MDHINQHSTKGLGISIKAFDLISYNIKKDLLSDLEDFDSITNKSIDNKDKEQQDEKCELTSTSYEKNVNVSKSNLQELTDTELVDGNIVSMHTSSPSTALPIMQSLRKSTQHTCKHCCLCNKVFGLFDNPLHIGWIQNIDKQNEFLKIEPSLRIDACLCDFCWKFLEKTNKSNRAQKINEESFDEKKARLLECWWKKIPKNELSCSIHLCPKDYCHKMSVNEYENIKKILSMFESCHLIFIKFTKKTTDFLRFPFRFCEDHNAMITVMSSCQICSCKLNEPFNTDDWSMYETWNRVLIANNLPLILQRGMFICKTCRGHISKSNPGFPTKGLPRLLKNITINNAIRLKLYGESQHNLFDICQGSTYVTSPIVPKVKENKESVCSTKVKFTDPLITTTYHYEIDHDKNDTKSITNTALLNVGEQNLVNPKLEPQEEILEEEHLYADSTPNTSSIEMTNSLNENVDDMPENILSKQNYPSNLTDNHVSNDFLNHLSYATTNHERLEEENVYTDSTPNTSSIEMTNSLNENVDDTPENILSEQIYPSNLTDNHVSNDFFNHLSYATTNHILRHDDDKDLQLHGNHQLKNYDIKISKNEKINQYPGISEDNSFQNLCKVNNVEIAINESEIIDSRQVTNGHNEIKNNQRKLNSDYIICNVVQEKSSTDLNEVNQCTDEIYTIHKTVNLNEADNSMYSCIAAVEPPNVICDNISNKIVKKPRLTEKYSSYEINSIDNNTKKSFGNKNITHPSTNSPSILNMVSNSKNKYVLNSDFIGVQDLSSDVDEESLKLQSSYLLKDIESNTNVPSIRIDKVFSLNPSCANSLRLKHLFNKIPYSCSKEKYSRKGVKNVLLDNNISDSESLPETITLSEHGSLSDSKIEVSDSNILSDSEEFSESDNESMLLDEPKEENDFMIIKNCNNSDFDCNKIFKCTPVTTFKVVDKKSDCEVVLNDVTVFRTKSNENGNKTYMCVYKEKIGPFGDKGSACIIIYDNEESNNTSLLTYKVNVRKGLDYKILLDNERVKIVLESKNINKPSNILFNKRIEPSSNKASTCIIIMDNEKENCSEQLFTFKTISNMKNPYRKILSGEELFSIVSSTGRIQYTASYEVESNSNDKKYCCFFQPNNEDINKKNVENDSDNQKIYNKKISDVITMPKEIIDVDNSHGDNKLDKVQEYFKDIFFALQYFFKTTPNKSHRDLYSKIGNNRDMLLYLMENFRMFYNEDLVISETADEFSKNYLKEQKKILYDCFGEPNNSINASKTFIHPSSHLHQYSKRLSADVIPLPIQDMPTSISLKKSNSIASKVQTQVSKDKTPNLGQMILPVAIKQKNLW